MLHWFFKMTTNLKYFLIKMMQSYPVRALDRRLQEDWAKDARDGERECVSPRTIEELGVKVINKTSTWSCTSVHQWGIRRSLVSPSDSIHSSSSTHTHHFLTQPTLFLHTEYYYSIQYKYFYDSTWKMVNIGYTV